MKLVVNKDVIIDGLQKVQSIVGSRTTLPVLYNVCLTADKEGLMLSATDLEVSVRTRVEAKVTRAGGTTLPARRVFSIFREVAANEIEIDVDDKDVATIRAGASVFKIIGISEDEFPPMPKFEGGKQYVLDQGTFRRMLACTHFAASSDESRYILNGVLLSFRGGKLTVVATDGRRMAHFEQEVEFLKEGERDLVVPSKAVHELLRSLASEGTETIKLTVTENQAAFEFGHILLVTKLLEGTYPNFKQVIPPHCEERVVMERESLMNAIRRVAILVSDKSNSITLSFSKNKLLISAVSPEVGEATEAVAVKYSGKEISVSFNPEFILDPLRNVDEEEVALELTDELSPGILKTSKPFLYVLMPMRVK
jgi:DNA polymerase-3 subunit beta